MRTDIHIFAVKGVNTDIGCTGTRPPDNTKSIFKFTCEYRFKLRMPVIRCDGICIERSKIGLYLIVEFRIFRIPSLFCLVEQVRYRRTVVCFKKAFYRIPIGLHSSKPSFLILHSPRFQGSTTQFFAFIP